MRIDQKNDPTSVFDKHFAVICPHCGVHANLTAVSIPRYEFVTRFNPTNIGVVYRCDSCNEPVFLKFRLGNRGTGFIYIEPSYEEVQRPSETFEFQYLPTGVAEDFREALACYSVACFNAFAAMCRRCIQSISARLGGDGKDKVLAQLKDLRTTASLDDETYSIMEQVVISGHDGAHPYLPNLSKERAGVLLELMKDVLYQLFVRKAKIEEAIKLRQQTIDQSKKDDAA